MNSICLSVLSRALQRGSYKKAVPMSCQKAQMKHMAEKNRKKTKRIITLSAIKNQTVYYFSAFDLSAIESLT